jgi:hypothetical protein
VNELFKTSDFSSLDDATRDLRKENLSSKKKVAVRCLRQPYGTQSKVDPAWDNKSAFPEVSSKNFKVGDAGDGKSFKVGDRCEILTLKKYSGEKGHVCGCHDDGSSEFWVKLDSHDLQIRVLASEVRFLEEKGTNAECNLNNLTSAQELEPDCLNTQASLQESPVLNLELEQPGQANSSKQNCLLKTTPTLKQSSNTDFLVSASTATSETTAPAVENLTCTQLDFLALEPQLQETKQDSTIQNQNFGLKPCGALQTGNQTLQSSKILQDLSTEDYEQCLEDSEWQAIAGTIRKSYQLRNSEVHTKEKDFSLLPTPTTYAKGSTGCRPAGQTRLEQRLRTFIKSGDKLNSAVPGWMMGFPVGWVEKVLMDGGEAISIQLPFTQEYATTSINAENVTTSTPDQSAPSKQRSQLSGSVTSPRTQILRANAQPGTYIIDQYESLGIIKDNFDLGFVVDWLGFGKVPVPISGQNLSYIWERDDELVGKLAIAPQALIEKFLEETQLISTINAPSVTHSDAELPASPSVESFISTQLLSTQEIIEALSISEDELDEFWNNEPALFKGFKIQWLGATIQKWRVESENRLPQSESIPEKFLEDKRQSPSIEPLSLSQ